MPGGAPLASPRAGVSTKRKPSKRACKYGPRDADGYCPKAPKVSRSSKPPKAARAKPTCKYGPRDANGFCPKKPKVTRDKKAIAVKDYESVDRAASQAGQVLRSSKATKEQKHEAVSVLASAVGGEVAKKVGEHAAREIKKASGNPKAQAAIKKALGSLPILGGLGVAAGAATVYAAAKGIGREHDKRARAWADAQLATTRKSTRLTQAQADVLWKQYYDFALKQAAATNTFIGK
jgi:hypothetical protein